MNVQSNIDLNFSFSRCRSLDTAAWLAKLYTHQLKNRFNEASERTAW